MLKPGAMWVPVPTGKLVFGNKRYGREDSDEFFSRIADTPARAPMASGFQVATQGQRLSQASCRAHQNIKKPRASIPLDGERAGVLEGAKALDFAGFLLREVLSVRLLPTKLKSWPCPENRRRELQGSFRRIRGLAKFPPPTTPIDSVTAPLVSSLK